MNACISSNTVIDTHEIDVAFETIFTSIEHKTFKQNEIYFYSCAIFYAWHNNEKVSTNKVNVECKTIIFDL